MNTYKKIGIWGYGKEGQSAHKFLSAKYPQAEFTILSDKKPADKKSDDGGVEIWGEKALNMVRNGEFGLLVKSPGVSLYREEIASAKQKGTVITSTTNLWFENNPRTKKIVITGTKGKSTTSSLLNYMLEISGQKTTFAGNIGTPLLDCSAGEDFTVLELSSYQLADLELAPDYLLITNLYPAHQAWHGGLEQYYKDKLRPVFLPNPPLIVANFANAELVKRLKDISNIHWFNKPNGYHIVAGELYRGQNKLQHNSPLKGEHNLENLAAVLTLLDIIGVKTSATDSAKLLNKLADFQPLPHRLSEIGVIQGRTCVNDSIATVLQSTFAALEAYKDKPIVLIMGGENKGQSYAELGQQLAKYNIRHICLIPDNGEIIAADLHSFVQHQSANKKGENNYEITMCDSLQSAVSKAFAVSEKGDIILLSPSAPSFGRFANFMERGEFFTKYCNNHG